MVDMLIRIFRPDRVLTLMSQFGFGLFASTIRDRAAFMANLRFKWAVAVPQQLLSRTSLQLPGSSPLLDSND